jgi:hypothetical protein
MQQGACSEADSSLADQEIPCFHGTQMFITVSQKLTTEPSHPISLRSISPTYRCIYVFQVVSSFQIRLKYVCTSYACYMSRRIHNVAKFLITQFSPFLLFPLS